MFRFKKHLLLEKNVALSWEPIHLDQSVDRYWYFGSEFYCTTTIPTKPTCQNKGFFFFIFLPIGQSLFYFNDEGKFCQAYGLGQLAQIKIFYVLQRLTDNAYKYPKDKLYRWNGHICCFFLRNP